MQEETKLVYKNFWFFISITVILLFISLFAYLDILQKNLKAEMSQNIMEIAEMEAELARLRALAGEGGAKPEKPTEATSEETPKDGE